MSVQELKALHAQYVHLSDRFRAAWAFYQFLQSVQKIFLPEQVPKGGPEFHELYARLKSLSQSLNASEAERVGNEISALSKRLAELTAQQLVEDSKVPPHFLRQFFQRVKSYDRKILTQLVKFYLYAVDLGGWDPDRIDKADFLLARLALDSVDPTGVSRLKDRSELREILGGLWRVLDREQPPESLVQAHTRAVKELRDEAKAINNLEELSDQNLIPRYRELKHSLGDLFFHPALAEEILTTNNLLQNTVNRMYRHEERRIISDYQRIFELEREVPRDMELEGELSQFREAVERFEEQLEGKEVNLQDLAAIRDRVRTLLPRLSEARGDGMDMRASTDTAPQALVNPLESETQGSSDDLAPVVERIKSALEEVNPSLGPKQVAVSREVYPFRLEPREVVAYRRLQNDPKCDRPLERFLLESSALRVQINESADEVKGILDETAVTGDGPAFRRSRRLCSRADSFVRQFDHLIDRSLMAGEIKDAHQLQISRMRLLRDYSGLWLLAHRRFLGQGA